MVVRICGHFHVNIKLTEWMGVALISPFRRGSFQQRLTEVERIKFAVSGCGC